MELSSLTLILTEQCNFNCSYCYQTRGEKRINLSTIKKAIDFLFPYFRDSVYINFYGGEPLLEREQIFRTVEYINGNNTDCNINFSITSNCSLMDLNTLEFLNRHRFSLLISFDGMAQDITRKKGSLKQTSKTIAKILTYRNITASVNSIFTPKTIHLLSSSMATTMAMGVKEITLGLSSLSPWDERAIKTLRRELEELTGILSEHYKESESIPVTNFRPNSKTGIFACNAGLNRLSLSPQGEIWGCHLFWDYFKNKKGEPDYLTYCFGSLDDFILNKPHMYQKTLSHYADLRMDYFSMKGKPCFSCNHINHCMVCPIDAAFSGEKIGEVPPWICRINKTLQEYKEHFNH